MAVYPSWMNGHFYVQSLFSETICCQLNINEDFTPSL